MARQDPAPLLARVPAGAIRESFDLVWRKFASLTSGSLALTRETAPRAFVNLNANIAIPDSTPTIVSWDALVYGAAGGKGMFNTAFPTRITIPRDTPAGSVWAIDAHAQFETSASGRRIVEIFYNDNSGATLLSSTIVDAAPGAQTRIQTSTVLLDPTPGIYLTISVEQTSGSPKDLEADQTFFSIVRLF